MNDSIGFLTSAAVSAPIGRITKVRSIKVTCPEKCEAILNFGIFFDGTENNMVRDKPSFKHTNIARLYEKYNRSLKDGYRCLYVPGVGTPFPEIGEKGESNLGNGFAIGCEERVLYALCFFVNSIQHAALGRFLWSSDEVKALCRSQSLNFNVTHQEDSAQLKTMGFEDGLRMGHFFGEGKRTSLLLAQAKSIEHKIAQSKPRITECFVDIFGFSRGAAQARVFTKWLEEILDRGKFAGIKVHFRFLGIFDTVASAGFFSGMVGGIAGGDGGHSGWAHHLSLQIPLSVKYCIHMVAMHELRKNFPLDSVRVNGVLPPNCQEFAYPGAHSDVGGGYGPADLGVSVGADLREGDSLKLSQISLQHMFECAVAAGVPLAAVLKPDDSTYNSFAIHPRLKKAFLGFLEVSGPHPRAMHEWSQPYLNWRNEIRHRYSSQKHVQLASAKDRILLNEFNRWFCLHAGLLRDNAKRKTQLLGFVGFFNRVPEMVLDDEAPDIWKIANSAAPSSDKILTLFDEFVHDSMAGFDHQALEVSGYWRYRKGFSGDGAVKTADVAVDSERVRNTA